MVSRSINSRIVTDNVYVFMNPSLTMVHYFLLCAKRRPSRVLVTSRGVQHSEPYGWFRNATTQPSGDCAGRHADADVVGVLFITQ